MNNEQLIQLRFNIALQMGKEKSIPEMNELYEWVIGPKSSIIPATSVTVVK